MKDNDPSPWEVVNDYTKTVVTVSAAFLAFTGTFSTSDRFATVPAWPLFTCWGLLVFAIAAALFSAGRLTSFLRHGGVERERICLRAANVSYFALFSAILAFFYFAFTATADRDANVESIRAMQVASGYLQKIEPKLDQQMSVREIAWNVATRAWEVRFQSGTNSVTITVDPKDMKVIRLVK